MRQTHFSKRLVTAVCLLVSLSISAFAADVPPIKILFIGNSYIFMNDMPDMFMAMAQASERKVEISSILVPGASLEVHWKKGQALKEIQRQHWDYVVIQEHSLLNGKITPKGEILLGNPATGLWRYGKAFAEVAKKSGAQPVFLMTWKRKFALDHYQDMLAMAYEKAAKDNHGYLAPVGLAWRQFQRQDTSIDLYAEDGSHPSPSGSYIEACTLYSTIFGKGPDKLPLRVEGHKFDERRLAFGLESRTLIVLPEPLARQLCNVGMETSKKFVK